jgi:hypothetical protein
MDNLDVKVSGNKLIITVLDLTKDCGPSASGKTLKCASTGGFQRYAGEFGEVSLSLNVTKPVR